MRGRRMILFVGFLVLAGCATLSKEECRSGNWREFGVRDGLKGEPAARIEEHRKACAEHGIRPDERRYLAGREEGLREYCRIDNAFQSGLEGRPFTGVCPPDVHMLFMRYNSAAYAVYETREEIRRTHSTISSKQSQIDSKKTKDSERKNLRADIRQLERKLDELRDRLHDRERELDSLMAEERDKRLRGR